MDDSVSQSRPARAVALSVVIDGRLDAARARQVAVLVGRLGLAGVWRRQPWWPLTGPVMSDADNASLLTWLAASAPARAGLVVDADRTDPEWLDRVEVAGQGMRVALSGAPASVARWQSLITRGLVTHGSGMAATELALPAPAPATAVFIPCSAGRELESAVTAAATAAGGRAVLAEVPVSVGRTVAEARARANADELFTLTGHPAAQGLFGTLEECQAAAARLAHAGATELVCYLPLASDLPDILAQLRSIVIGAGVLRPGEPPSAAPPPPDGWGGRRVEA
jgi:hypothetical protein